MRPFYQEIPYRSPEILFESVHQEPWAILLHSSLIDPHCGRYSYISFDPFLMLRSKSSEENPWDGLRSKLSEFSFETHENLPPFQGGVMGFLGYEMAHHLEKLKQLPDELHVDDMMIGFYDCVIAFDELKKKAWVFSSGFPEKTPELREKRALLRMETCLKKIKVCENLQIKPHSRGGGNPVFQKGFLLQPSNLGKPISNVSPQAYEQAVQKVIDYIHAGDVFQVNLSHRFSMPFSSQQTYPLYQKLCEINPVPFSAYLNFDGSVILSASPERFLKLEGRKIEGRPIKGTRRRGANPQEDEALMAELIASEKDCAENTMIVDLVRNDLSKVCRPHSIRVTQLCQLETCPSVHHLVSAVEGELRDDVQAIDAVMASFPCGSVTGAPKVRAMEIISELEGQARGPYYGSILYIGFDGCMDSSVIIRTLLIKDGLLSYQVGGGIVSDSDPLAEYEETLVKAKALKCF